MIDRATARIAAVPDDARRPFHQSEAQVRRYRLARARVAGLRVPRVRHLHLVRTYD